MVTLRTAGLSGRSPRQPGSRGWLVPVALILLSAISLLAGALRIVQLMGGPELIPADPRFAGFPLAVGAHIVGASTYLVIGAFQFVPRFRRRHLGWHRRAGRVLAVAGMLVAGSALWMTLFYAMKPGTGSLLYVLRLVFGVAMAACLVRGIATVRRGDIAGHRAWMIRAYAIGLAGGTQAFTGGIGLALLGDGTLQRDIATSSAWFINLAVAEWVIRRPARSASARRLARAEQGTSHAGASS